MLQLNRRCYSTNQHVRSVVIAVVMEQGAPETGLGSGSSSPATANPATAAAAAAAGSASIPLKSTGRRSWKARPPKVGSAAGTAPTAAPMPTGVPQGVPTAAAPSLVPTKSQDSHTGSKGTADVNQHAPMPPQGIPQYPAPLPAQASMSGGTMPTQQTYQQMPYPASHVQPAVHGHPQYHSQYPMTHPGFVQYHQYANITGMGQQPVGLYANPAGAGVPVYPTSSVPPGYNPGLQLQQQQQQPRLQLTQQVLDAAQSFNTAGAQLPLYLLEQVAAALNLSQQEVQQRVVEKRLWDGYDVRLSMHGTQATAGMQPQPSGHQLTTSVQPGMAAQPAPGGPLGTMPYGAPIGAQPETLPSTSSAGYSAGTAPAGSHGLASGGGSTAHQQVAGTAPLFAVQPPAAGMMQPPYVQYAAYMPPGIPSGVAGLPPGWQQPLQQPMSSMMVQPQYSAGGPGMAQGMTPGMGPGTAQGMAPGMAPGPLPSYPGYAPQPQQVQPTPSQTAPQHAGTPNTQSTYSMLDLKHPLQQTAGDVAAEHRDLPSRAVSSLQFIPGQLCPLHQDEQRVCGMTVHPCLKEWWSNCAAQWRHRIEQKETAEDREEIFEEFEKQVNVNLHYESRAKQLCGSLRAMRKAVAQCIGVQGMAALPSVLELRGVRAVQDDSRLGRGLVAAQDLPQGYILGPLGGYILPGGPTAHDSRQQHDTLVAHQCSAAGRSGRNSAPLQAGGDAPQNVDWSLDTTRYTFHIDLTVQHEGAGGTQQVVSMDVWGLGYGNMGMLINDAFSEPHEWGKKAAKLQADEAKAAAEYAGKGNNVQVMVVEVRGMPIPMLVTNQHIAAGEPLRNDYDLPYWRAHYDALNNQRNWYLDKRDEKPLNREKLDSLLPLCADASATSACEGMTTAALPTGAHAQPSAPSVPQAAVKPEQPSVPQHAVKSEQPSVPQHAVKSEQPTVPQPAIPSEQQPAVQSTIKSESQQPALQTTAQLPLNQAGGSLGVTGTSVDVEAVRARRRARYAELRDTAGLQQPAVVAGSALGGNTSLPIAGKSAVGQNAPELAADLLTGAPPANATAPAEQPTSGLVAQGSDEAGAIASAQLQTVQAGVLPVSTDSDYRAKRRAIMRSSAVNFDNPLEAAQPQSPVSQSQATTAAVAAAGEHGTLPSPSVREARRDRFRRIEQERRAVLSTGAPAVAEATSAAPAAVAGATDGAGGTDGAGVNAAAPTVQDVHTAPAAVEVPAPVCTVANGTAQHHGHAAGTSDKQPLAPAEPASDAAIAHMEQANAPQKRTREEGIDWQQPPGNGNDANVKRARDDAAANRANMPPLPPPLPPPPGVIPHNGALTTAQPPTDFAAAAKAAYEARMAEAAAANKNVDGSQRFLFECWNDGSWQQMVQQEPWYAQQLRSIEELCSVVTFQQ